MSEKWKASSLTNELLHDLVGNCHPHLVDVMDDIAIIFKDKASRKGETPIMGTTAKAPAILSVLGEREYKFVITLANDCWALLNDEHRRALLDHLLCFIGGVEDEKTGEMKYFIQTPDVFYFSQEIERNGNWRVDVNLNPEEEEEETSDSEQTPIL